MLQPHQYAVCVRLLEQPKISYLTVAGVDGPNYLLLYRDFDLRRMVLLTRITRKNAGANDLHDIIGVMSSFALKFWRRPSPLAAAPW